MECLEKCSVSQVVKAGDCGSVDLGEAGQIKIHWLIDTCLRVDRVSMN